MKVTYGSVFGQQIDSWFHQDVVQLLFARPPDGYEWASNSVAVKSGPLLASGRGHLLGNFIEHSDGDVLTMIDADQSFTPERYWDLIRCFDQTRQEHGDNIGILAGVTWMSGHPKLEKPLPNIWQQGEHNGQFFHMTTYPPNCLIEVAAVGCSNLVMSREVAQYFVDKNINPFHHMSITNYRLMAQDFAAWDDPDKIEHTMREAVQNADQLGEDLSFCVRVREAGFRILVHTGLEFAHSKSYLLDGDDYRAAVLKYGPESAHALVMPNQEPTDDEPDPS